MRVLILLLLLGCNFCSPLQVKSQVEVERSDHIRYYEKTYAFLPFFGQAPPIIIRENEDLIREKLAEKGYKEVDISRADQLIHYDILIFPRGSVIDHKADLGAFGGWTSARGMRYHSYGGTSSRLAAVPILGSVGGYSPFAFMGNFGNSRISGGSPYYENFYDVIFKLVIYDGKRYRGLPSSVLLKANVEGEGRSGPMFDVIPYLITGFFKSFPNFAGEKNEIISEEEVWRGH